MAKTKKICRLLAGIVLVVSVWMPISQAAFDYRYDSKEDIKGQYESDSATKLTRGVTNILFGWTEIGRTPAQMAAGIEHGALTSFLFGVPYGVLRAVGRTGVGAYETATFFAPQSPIMKDIQGDVL